MITPKICDSMCHLHQENDRICESPSVWSRDRRLYSGNETPLSPWNSKTKDDVAIWPTFFVQCGVPAWKKRTAGADISTCIVLIQPSINTKARSWACLCGLTPGSIFRSWTLAHKFLKYLVGISNRRTMLNPDPNFDIGSRSRSDWLKTNDFGISSFELWSIKN